MSKKAHHIYEFGPFRLDTAEHVLLRDGVPVPLTPKAFETLVVLIERSGHLVEKGELIQTLWPDSFVEETNLNHHVWALRKALGRGQTGEHYIETVPRRGFRFTASVRELPDGDEEWVVEKRTLTRVVTLEEDVVQMQGQAVPPAGQKLLPAEGPGRGWRRRPLIAAGLLCLLVTGILLAVYRPWASRQTGASGVGMTDRRPLRSLAVLPFKTIGPEGGDSEYLGIGMSDALITRLSKSRQVVVRPTGAVRRYTDPHQDPVAAGREQGVDAVLDGSVQLAGDRIRLTVHLVRVQDGASLWSGQFDERFTDIFTVQDSISQRVMGELMVELSPEEKERLRKPDKHNIEAYQAYLKGRFFWNKRTAEGFKKAIEYFHQAIENDPDYALAYVGLADSYLLLADYDWIPPLETQAKAKAAVNHALKIDDTLAEAHATLADILKFYDWNWAAAESEYKRAIELNPNYATAHQWYAEFLAGMGRREEAINEIRRAIELDPLSLVVHSAAGWVYLFTRDYDEAIRECQRVLELDPNYFEVYSQLRRAYEQKGMYDEAFEANEKYRARKGYSAEKVRRPAQARDAKAYWRAMLEATQKEADKEVTTLRMAEIYAQLGEKEKACEWLEKAYQAHSFWMPYLNAHPHLDPLRSDACLTGLLRRIGLAP